jgi:hypothetical protein
MAITEGLTTPSPIHFKCLPKESELLWIGATPPESGGETFAVHIQRVSPPNLGGVPKSM